MLVSLSNMVIVFRNYEQSLSCTWKEQNELCCTSNTFGLRTKLYSWSHAGLCSALSRNQIYIPSFTV